MDKDKKPKQEKPTPDTKPNNSIEGKLNENTLPSFQNPPPPPPPKEKKQELVNIVSGKYGNDNK